MSGKKKAAFTALVVSILGALAFALGGGAATGAHGTFVLKSETQTALGEGDVGVDTTQSNGPEVKLRIGLVESATNTKTYVSNGVGCGNTSMNYSRATTSSQTYTVGRHSSWKAGVNCGSGTSGVRGSLTDVYFVANDGTQSYRGTILNGETNAWFRVSTGTASTKTQWTRQDMTPSANDHISCGVTIPGGGGGWYPDTACI